MADVQIAVIDQQNTQITRAAPSETVITLAVPGVQGPSGVANFFDVSGATHTLAEVNRSRIGRFTSSSAITITIPTGLSANFDCMILQLGTGQITIAGDVGVTLYSALSATKSAYQYGAINVICIGTDEFLLTGELTT